MKSVATLILTLITSNAFAGIGGYTSTTCTSNSGRTVVTLAQSDELETKLTLIMDGQAAVYSQDDKNVSFSGNDDVLIVKKNGSIELSISNKNKDRVLRVQEGADPRIGTFASSNSKSALQEINVSCKEFVQQP